MSYLDAMIYLSILDDETREAVFKLAEDSGINLPALLDEAAEDERERD